MKPLVLGWVPLLQYWGGISKEKYLCTLFFLRDQGEDNIIRLSASARFSDKNGVQKYTTTDIASLAAFTELKSNESLLSAIALLHLYKDGIHAGSPLQETEVRRGFALGLYPSMDIRQTMPEQKEWLTKHGLFEIPAPDGTPYRYGHGWHMGKPVPEHHIVKIRELAGD